MGEEPQLGWAWRRKDELTQHRSVFLCRLWNYIHICIHGAFSWRILFTRLICGGTQECVIFRITPGNSVNQTRFLNSVMICCINTSFNGSQSGNSGKRLPPELLDRSVCSRSENLYCFRLPGDVHSLQTSGLDCALQTEAEDSQENTQKPLQFVYWNLGFCSCCLRNKKMVAAAVFKPGAGASNSWNGRDSGPWSSQASEGRRGSRPEWRGAGGGK